MKLTIFGSTGSVGRHLADQALEDGHEVTAFTRNREKIAQNHDNLQVVQGDVLNPVAVQDAINGRDAVLCALGMPLRNREKLRARGTMNIIQGMQETGVRRLVCLSGLGAGDSRELLPFHYKYLIFPLILRHVFADHEDQEGHVRRSHLDWVLARPGNFSKGARTGSYRHGFTAGDRPSALKISHADVADFMLKQLSDDTYLHRAASLSY